MDDFRVDVSITGSMATLHVSGEVDAATAPVLDEHLRKVEAIGGLNEIQVDLGAVAFIDSSGLSALIAAHKRHRDMPLALVVTNPSPSTQRVFAIAGLDRVLTIR